MEGDTELQDAASCVVAALPTKANLAVTRYHFQKPLIVRLTVWLLGASLKHDLMPQHFSNWRDRLGAMANRVP